MVTKCKIGALFNIEKGTVQSSKNISGNYNFITASAEWKTHNEYSHDCEAIIFAMGAAGSLGRTHYVNGKFIASDLCFILTPKNETQNQIDLKFYYLYFNLIREEIVKKTATGTSKLAINIKNFSNYEVITPSIDEQMKAKDLIESIQPLSSALTVLVNQSYEDILALRQSIFELAIQGKLVPQDSSDEPARELLKKIKTEKEQLLKAKNEKSASSINNNDLPFEIPKSWEWVRFQELLKTIKYGTSKKCEFESGNTPVLRIPNIRNGELDLSDLKFTDLTDSEKEELALEDSDLLMIRSNGSASLVGRVAKISSNAKGFAYAGYLVRLRTMKVYINAEYLMIALNSQLVRKQIEIPIRTTTGVKNINTSEISNIILPLPPLNEQRRIVEKVNQLIAFCDELENKIGQSRNESEKLMQVIFQGEFITSDSEENVVEFSK